MRLLNRQSLVCQQYKKPSNLNGRGELHRRFSTNKHGWLKWIFEQFDLPEECTVLELGCGTGDLWTANSNRISRQWHIILSDISPGMIREAKKNHQAIKPSIRYMLFNAQHVPFSSECLDGVIANNMLYHIPNLKKTLAEIQRTLKPGGVFYAATQGLNHMHELRDLLGRYSYKARIFNPALAFGLENGATMFKNYFNKVIRRRYPDSLAVTETKPLIAYINSTLYATSLKKNLKTIRQEIEQKINASGALRIQKDSGMFIARKSEKPYGACCVRVRAHRRAGG